MGNLTKVADDAITNAARRAWENKGECFTVYTDGQNWYVRDSEAAPPPDAKVHCIAQYWGDRAVQVRYNGAWSEWKHF